MDERRMTLFARGFRPFFLGAGLVAALWMAIFLVAYATGYWHYNYYPLALWHVHEMLFGFGAAAAAGFLLTSVTNWTGRQTAAGRWLAALFLLWLAGRLLPAVPGLPPLAVAVTDLLFLPLLSFALWRPVRAARQWRNLGAPLLALWLAVANLLLHLEILGHASSAAVGARLGIYGLLLFVAWIGGRVLPFFAERALPGARPRRSPRLDRRAIGSLAAGALLSIADVGVAAPAVLLAAAALHGARLLGWWDRRVIGEPMLWVLFAAYGWLVAGLLLHALALLGLVAERPALHAMTVGTIGMMIIGMMARVALGHTGRPVRVVRGMRLAFALVGVAALLRVVPPLLAPAAATGAIHAAGLAWILAFAIFLCRYAPMLLRPRVDGRAG